MKLRNKLIPLASGLVTVATVAPVSLTACSSAGWTDLKDGFTPSFSRLAVEGNKLYTDEGEQVYFNAVSENPDIFAQDYNWTMSLALRAVSDIADNSQIDTAKQSVTNVKVGKTTVETLLGSVQYYTLSFTYTREQQFTWNRLEDVGGYGESQVKTVGQTLYSMEAKNIPMCFNVPNTKLNNHPTGKDNDNYVWQLGRGLFSDSAVGSKVISYLDNHTKWQLSPAFFGEYPIIYFMKDPWSIKYSYKENDVEYTTYNDITSAHGTGNSYEGTFDNSSFESEIEPSEETSNVIEELLSFTCASFYMSDITNAGIKK